MTQPPGGRDPFEYTENSVVAKVAVEVPNEAVQGLEGVLRRTEDLRTLMEAVARANQDVVSYLREMPSLMENVSAAQSRFQTAVVVARGGDPRVPLSGRNDPRGAGSAVESELTAGTGAGRGEVTPASEADVAQQLEDLAERDPRQFANLVEQRARRTPPGRPPGPPRPGGGRPPPRPDSSPRPADTPPLEVEPENRSRRTSPDNTPPGGNPPPGRDWMDQAQDRARLTNDLLNQVLKETRAGGTGMGNLGTGVGMARRGFGALSGHIEQQQGIVARALEEHLAAGGTEETFQLPAGMSGLGRMIGGMGGGEGGGAAAAAGGRLGGMGAAASIGLKAAGAVGIGVTALQATQQIGEQYQQYKNMGMVRGGGFTEGVGYEMSIRTMAMSPFLNTDQSRQIIQTALSQGYTGKEFDTVTDFMADNLKNMNLSVADSVKLLNTNVKEGGQSIASLNTQLETMKGLSGGGYSTLQNRQQIFEQVSGQAVQQGASGEQAGGMGMLAGEMFSGDKVMAGQGQNLVNAMQSNLAMQQGIRRQYGLTNVPRDQLMSVALQAAGGDEAAVMTAGLGPLQTALQNGPGRMLANSRGNPAQRALALRSARGLLTRYGVIDQSASDQVVERYLAAAIDGNLVKEVGTAQGKITEQEERVADTQSGIGGKVAGALGIKPMAKMVGGDVKMVTGLVGDIGEGIGGLFGFGNGNEGWENTRAATKETTSDMAIAAGRYQNDRISELLKQYGAGSVRVEKPGGGTQALNMNDKALMDAVSKGQRKVSVNGGEMMTLSEATSMQNDQGGNVNQALVDLTPRAQRLVQLMDATGGRSNTQQGADSGYNKNQNNAPTPSETAPWTSGGR